MRRVTTLAHGFTVDSIDGIDWGGQNAGPRPVPSAKVLANVSALAKAADVIVMAIGEGPEAETGGDTNQLDLSKAQQVLFAAVHAAARPSAEIVTVLVGARCENHEFM